MAQFHGHHCSAVEYERRKFCLRWSKLHARNMSGLQVQRWGEPDGVQSDRSGIVSAAPRYWYTSRGRNEPGSVGNATNSTESVQASNICRCWHFDWGNLELIGAV